MNTKPILREEMKAQIDDTYKEAAEAVRLKIAALLTRQGMHQSCVNCRHFSTTSELCALFNARPPAYVIAYSCERYEDEQSIPF